MASIVLVLVVVFVSVGQKAVRGVPRGPTRAKALEVKLAGARLLNFV